MTMTTRITGKIPLKLAGARNIAADFDHTTSMAKCCITATHQD